MAQEKNVDDKPSHSDGASPRRDRRHRKRCRNRMCRSHSPPPPRRSPPHKRRKGDDPEADHDSGGSSSRHDQEDYGTMKRTFFNAHKHQDWLKDKYHPTNLLTIIKRRKEVARKLAEDFKRDLCCDKLDIGPAANPKGAEESDLTAAPKARPVSSEPSRVRVDITRAQALVKKLDVEKGILNNVLWESHSSSSGPFITIEVGDTSRSLKGVELLDTLLTYLWRIHGVDYYGMTEAPNPQGFRHVRAEVKDVGSFGCDLEWERKLDSRWQVRIEKEDPLEVMAAEEKIDAATAQVLEPHISKVSDEKLGWKYGCEAEDCTKFFRGPEFVQKHLKLKHSEFVKELTSKLLDDLYFQNYMSDKNGPGGKPAMQQQPQREKRRPYINIDLDSFSHEQVPQPAGPMDIFAPAPPALAMQMLQLQDGHSPFPGHHLGGPSTSERGSGSGRLSSEPPPLEGGSGSGLGSGHHIGGPSPRIVLPPRRVGRDPRSLQRYDDVVDGPGDDDMTVEDYRRL